MLYFCCFGALFALFQRSIFLLQVLYFRVQVFYFSCPGALFDRPPPPRGLTPQSLPCSQHGEALLIVQPESDMLSSEIVPLICLDKSSALVPCPTRIRIIVLLDN